MDHNQDNPRRQVGQQPPSRGPLQLGYQPQYNLEYQPQFQFGLAYHLAPEARSLHGQPPIYYPDGSVNWPNNQQGYYPMTAYDPNQAPRQPVQGQFDNSFNPAAQTLEPQDNQTQAVGELCNINTSFAIDPRLIAADMANTYRAKETTSTSDHEVSEPTPTFDSDSGNLSTVLPWSPVATEDERPAPIIAAAQMNPSPGRTVLNLNLGSIVCENAKALNNLADSIQVALNKGIIRFGLILAKIQKLEQEIAYAAAAVNTTSDEKDAQSEFAEEKDEEDASMKKQDGIQAGGARKVGGRRVPGVKVPRVNARKTNERHARQVAFYQKDLKNRKQKEGFEILSELMDICNETLKKRLFEIHMMQVAISNFYEERESAEEQIRLSTIVGLITDCQKDLGEVEGSLKSSENIAV